MDRTAALRQKRWRQRQRRGQVVLPVPCNAVRVSDWLIEKGLLAEGDWSDSAKVGKAVGEFMEYLSDNRNALLGK